jgi:hypothetical protein
MGEEEGAREKRIRPDICCIKPHIFGRVLPSRRRVCNHEHVQQRKAARQGVAARKEVVFIGDWPSLRGCAFAGSTSRRGRLPAANQR